MVVCICANVNDRTIQAAIDLCPDLDYISATTGACTVCRVCKKEIDRMIKESTKSLGNTQSTVVSD